MSLKEDSWMGLKEDFQMGLKEGSQMKEGSWVETRHDWQMASGHKLQCVAVRDSICHTHGTTLQGRNTSTDTNTNKI